MRDAPNVDPRRLVEEGYDRLDEESLASLESADHDALRARYTSVLLEGLPPGAKVLELGCGSGVPTARILAERFEVTGVDLSARRIAMARKNVPRARFVHADLSRLELPPGSVDGIAAFYALFHIPRQDQPQLWRDMASWLRPGGLIVANLGPEPGEAAIEDFFGVPMFWSGYDSATNRRLIEQAGLRLLTAREETVVEVGEATTFMWVVAQKPDHEA